MCWLHVITKLTEWSFITVCRYVTQGQQLIGRPWPLMGCCHKGRFSKVSKLLMSLTHLYCSVFLSTKPFVLSIDLCYVNYITALFFIIIIIQGTFTNLKVRLFIIACLWRIGLKLFSLMQFSVYVLFLNIQKFNCIIPIVSLPSRQRDMHTLHALVQVQSSTGWASANQHHEECWVATDL